MTRTQKIQTRAAKLNVEVTKAQGGGWDMRATRTGATRFCAKLNTVEDELDAIERGGFKVYGQDELSTLGLLEV